MFHINLHHVPYLSPVFAVQMDVISYSAAISACEKSSEWQQSMWFSGEWKRMEADMMEGITPNHNEGSWGLGRSLIQHVEIELMCNMIPSLDMNAFSHHSPEESNPE